ncbi:hypothetical protein JJC03_09230 [Flavobacterium oreochromis]|uniref:hypothetical protein n=1 Tax=Flavobacterium oreochromis TaxID=2906078 RepID=UPI001CE6D5E8|nr:hypothetical protein [Flavobacterium oreochromis]QYS85420.1 hypothetical protein JJC03_09230 [Flavobacterium oreochromis]
MALTNEECIREMVTTIISYLDDEKVINENALKAYENNSLLDTDSDIRILREKEAIKLRDRITELSRHIAVIKRMFPNG